MSSLGLENSIRKRKKVTIELFGERRNSNRVLLHSHTEMYEYILGMSARVSLKSGQRMQ